jgi:flavin-dependent dehydrogenase
MGVAGAIRQEIPCMSFHTPHGSARYRLPWTWSSFDYPELCRLLFAQCDARFEIAKVEGRRAGAVVTDRGELSAPLVVDALGWRRVLCTRGYQPPDAPLSRGLEVHPHGGGRDLDVWIDRSLVRRGYCWSVPAAREQRVGAGSYEPRHHVKEPTVELARRLGVPPVAYQGNWFPHRLRRAAEDGVFFVGDSAGHCLPLSGEGIRTAFYFGVACGRELRAAVEGRQSVAAALTHYHDFNEAHRWKFDAMLLVQRLVPRVPPRLLAPALDAMTTKAFVDWSFNHYLQIAPPSIVGEAPAPAPTPVQSPRELEGAAA